MISQDKKSVGFIGALLLLALVIIAPTGARYFNTSLPDWWISAPLRLGLDLRGGTYLVMGVVTEEAVKSNLLGYAGQISTDLRKERLPILRAKQVGEQDVEITLLSDRDLDKVQSYLSSEFKDLAYVSQEKEGAKVLLRYRMKDVEAKEVKKRAVDQAIETIRTRVDSIGLTEPLIQRVGEDQIAVQLPDVTDIENVKKTIGKVAKLEFRIVAEGKESEEGDVESLRMKEGGSITVLREVAMTGDYVKTASVEMDPSDGTKYISLHLNSRGATRFDQVTADNVGRKLAIVLDRIVQSAPLINTRISGGTAQITGSFSPEESRQLAIVLRSGALPAPLIIQSERTVGASLGADSIRKGILSSVLGALMVVAFMILYYKKTGMLAVGSLFFNVLFLVALLAFFGGTLTLPGIAGIALTVGMAMDANVIIYERIKEEMRAGSSRDAAVSAGFLKARWTVLDANITTFLTGTILFMFGTGPVKGFALTLCLGILTSMFAALYITRLGFRLFPMVGRDRDLSI